MTQQAVDPPAATPLAAEVLVVDDNAATRYATSRVMRAAGFRVIEAATGRQGLDSADGKLAAIILDMHLPDLNGFEVCQVLRSRPATERVPVICLSAAYVRDDDKVHGLEAGADAYIVHPADPALLVATVRALMRARGAEEGMRRSEARFRAIYDHALCGICLIDTAGGFIDVNPAMLALLRRQKHEVVGRRVVDFAPPDQVATVAACIERSQQGMWQGDFPLLDARGELVFLAWSLSAHVEPGVSLAVANDVSERLALSAQREELLEREQAARAVAEHASRAKDNFMAVLSHELRTPLNAILNWIQVLKHSPSADLARGLESIERNARMQTRLISDLLDVSRMDLGKLRLQTGPIDAADVVGSAVSALSSLFQDRPVQVLVDIGGVREPVVADGARLQQIVWNLLTNAVKFSAPGGRIHVGLIQEGTELVLTVRDEGQGITPEFLPYLFDRFSQSDSASNRMHGGLGLGLSIVRHLVDLHHGTVTASSAGLGRGATFIVRIPMRPPMDENAQPQREDSAEAPERGPRQADLAGLSIVAVEDDAEAREVLVMILRDRGARVAAAAGYAEALQIIGQSRPDVLISDIGMAGSDGYALIREVRLREAAAGSKRLPAIAVTAFARAQDRALAREAGFDAHCAKPLQTGELIATIRRLVRGEAQSEVQSPGQGQAPNFAHEREQMVSRQIAARGIRDPAVLAAMRDVPRDVFVEPGSEPLAYRDRPLPIGEGQTISQPYIVALMLEAADLHASDRVLEVGAGSGYAAAVMSRIARRVDAIERHAPLVAAARERLRKLGYANVQVHVGDGSHGWPEAAPFDAIVVAAASGGEVPQALKEQLAPGGRLVIPVGNQAGYQHLIKIVRRGDSRYDEEHLADVRFVPLVSGQTRPDPAA